MTNTEIEFAQGLLEEVKSLRNTIAELTAQKDDLLKKVSLLERNNTMYYLIYDRTRMLADGALTYLFREIGKPSSKNSAVRKAMDFAIEEYDLAVTGEEKDILEVDWNKIDKYVREMMDDSSSSEGGAK